MSALRPKKKKSPDLRPLTSRALTSIIDTLRPNLPESKVLDLYSGKGRFGITALCEKAASVIFVERDKKNAEEIRKNLLKSPGKNHVYTMDVNPYLEKAKKEGELFDILFADPPFRLWKENFAEDLVAAVSGVLGAGSIFLVRYPKRMLASPPSGGFDFWKTSDFGESRILYLNFRG